MTAADRERLKKGDVLLVSDSAQETYGLLFEVEVVELRNYHLNGICRTGIGVSCDQRTGVWTEKTENRDPDLYDHSCFVRIVRNPKTKRAVDSIEDYVHDIYTMFVATDSQRRDLSVFERNLTGEQIAAAGRQFEAIRFGTMSEESAKALLRSALVEAGLKERCDARKTDS